MIAHLEGEGDVDVVLRGKVIIRGEIRFVVGVFFPFCLMLESSSLSQRVLFTLILSKYSLPCV